MDRQQRREAAAAYKARRMQGGVFQIRTRQPAASCCAIQPTCAAAATASNSRR